MDSPAPRSMNCISSHPCHRAFRFVPNRILEMHPVAKHLIHRWWDRYVSGDLEQAQWLGEAILNNMLMSRDLDGHLWGRIIAAITAEGQGEIETAQSLYRSIRLRAMQSPNFAEQHQMALVGLARIAYEQHDGAMLESLLEEFETLRIPGCLCARQISHITIKALHAMNQRQLVRALHVLLPINERLGSEFNRLFFKLMIAEIACLQGEPQSAIDQMHELSFQVDTGHMAGIFINYQRLLPNAVNIAQERALLFRRGIQPNITNLPTTQLGNPDRLVITTFGGCKVTYGRDVTQYVQGLDALLIAYLSMHPDGVSREDLARDIWSQPVEDDSIHRSMMRMRNALPSRDLILYSEGIYRFVDHTFSDILEFDRLWEQGHALPFEDRFSILRSASVIYHGSFLNGIQHHAWRDEIANKYRKRMGWLKWQLAGLYFRDGQSQEAVTLLEDAIEVNPYFQNGIEDLMRVLHYQEEHAQAVHSYQLWAVRLKSDLDIDPPDRLNELKTRVADAIPVTRAFSSGVLERAGVRGPRSLPRPTPPVLTSEQQPYQFARNMDEMRAKMRSTGWVPEADGGDGYGKAK